MYFLAHFWARWESQHERVCQRLGRPPSRHEHAFRNLVDTVLSKYALCPTGFRLRFYSEF